MNRYTMMAFASCLLIAGGGPKSDLDEIEGRWLSGVWVFNGDKTFVVQTVNPGTVLDIADGTAALRSRIAGTECWSYTLDKTRTPQTIDLTILAGPDKGRIRQGIYEISPLRHGGYYLTFCIAEPGSSRPSGFAE